MHNHQITNIFNLSLNSDHFHPILKQSIVSLLFKKSTLDKEQLSVDMMMMMDSIC